MITRGPDVEPTYGLDVDPMSKVAMGQYGFPTSDPRSKRRPITFEPTWAQRINAIWVANGKIVISRRKSLISIVYLNLFVTHRSTVARTVMCRQDGRGRFPVLLDDLSKCRTNSQRKSQLSWNFLYDIYIE